MSGGGRLRVLVVASKPPWPRIGGGNVTLHDLLGGLHEAGVELSLVAAARTPPPAPEVAPWSGVAVALVPGLPRPWWRSAAHLLAPPPVPLARFRSPALARAVEREIGRFQPDVVHLEQLHVAWLAATAQRAGCAAVLRAQNVESALAARWGAVATGWRGRLLAREARRLRRAEGAACAEVEEVLAISEADAAELETMAPDARVSVLPAAFAGFEASPAVPRLAGDPPILLLGSFDWGPTRDGAAWFLREGWPELTRRCPGARLHLAGPGSTALAVADEAAVVRHGVVEDAGRLLDPRAIAVVPVRVASGVRLRLLEAWAAGMAVVTTPLGGLGLVAADGDGARLADGALELCTAAVELAADSAARQRLVARGRERLAAHRPAVVAATAIAAYRRAIAAYHRRAAAGRADDGTQQGGADG